MLRNVVKYLAKRADNKAYKFYKFKTSVAEDIAIFRKRKLYKSVKWTKEQKQEFDSFSKKIYGRTIPTRWHKLYESINGSFNASYVPEKYLTTIVELNANDYNRSRVLEDKNLLPALLKGVIKVPETLISNTNGIFYNHAGEIISAERALQTTDNCGNVVIKPTVNTSSGKNIRFLNIINGVDEKTQMPINKLFDLYKKNFVVQKKLTQCKETNDIYSGSINTFRITTYALNGEIYTVPCSLRFGSGGGMLDNIHAGGYGVAVSDEGVLGKYAYKLGKGDCTDKIVKHPDTGIIFEGYVIPSFEKVITAAKIAHSRFGGIGFISWDIILNNEYEPVIIEANLIGQGYWFPQVIHGKGLFGDNLADIINCYFRK